MSLWSLYLVVITIALMMLPLVPGLFELFRPTDLEPLRVPQGYDSNPMHFADGFRGFIGKHDFGDKTSRINRDGSIKEVGKYQVVGIKGVPTLSNNPTVDRILISAYDLTLPADKLFEKEIYSTANITTNSNSYFRALLADKDLTIGSGSMVIRWAHADGDVVVGRKSTLLGRTTSRAKITLGEGCTFERLYAPKIVFIEEGEPPSTAYSIERTVLRELEDVRLKAERRHLLRGRLLIPERHVFDGDIVTLGRADIEDYAQLKGSIKCNAHKDIGRYVQKSGSIEESIRGNMRFRVGNHVRIDGSIFCTHDLFIGTNCLIGGPVIAENMLVIGSGTVIGTPDAPCSIIAKEVIVESGAVVYGTIWATKHGRVVIPAATGLKAVA